MLIDDLIREYGLWAVFFGVMIEGDLTLLLAGVLAHYGLFSFSEALLTGTLGGFVGDAISYLIGYTGKERIKNSHFYQRAKPRLERLCARFGVYSIFLVKYVYGLRTASAIFWGFAHMRLRRFGPLTLASCFVWTLLLAGSGYFFSGAIGVIIGEVRRLGLILLLAFIIACAIAVALYVIERYVIARRVPEMEPPLLHETLHETLHESLHEKREAD
jgi:membrane protein DedA with SNARE-associated domain